MSEFIFLDKEGKFILEKNKDGYRYLNIFGKTKDELILNLIKRCHVWMDAHFELKQKLDALSGDGEK